MKRHMYYAQRKGSLSHIFSYILIGTILIVSSLLLNPWNHYINALILLLGAIGVYFYIVIAVAEWNWMDIRAVFSGVWLATLGLAALRLTGYQEQWHHMTWILCAVGYFVFQVGSNIGLFFGNKYASRIKEWKPKWRRLTFYFQPNRIFWICTVTTLVGFVCFVINVAIRGYIPCFTNDTFAYLDFYTKFHVFATASTAVCGLCYYCIQTQEVSLAKKIVLWICIFYTLILFPVLVVSRGVFIVAALSFTTVVFFLHRRKLWVLFLCVVITGGVYMLMSNLRSLTDQQLDMIFEPSTITITNPSDSTDIPPTLVPGEVTDNETGASFTLSPKLAFLYGYLTVSHDNFNEAIKYLEGYTWGVRQLEPFNVILRQQWITDIIEQAEYYQVTVNLNTTNMIGIFYYELHEVGVIIFTLLWSCVFGLLQSTYLNFKGPFSLIILGYAMSPVALSFFSAWVNSFDLWMFCGTVLIFAVLSSVHLKKKKDN